MLLEEHRLAVPCCHPFRALPHPVTFRLRLRHSRPVLLARQPCFETTDREHRRRPDGRQTPGVRDVAQPGRELAGLGDEHRRRVDADRFGHSGRRASTRVTAPVPQPTSSTRAAEANPNSDREESSIARCWGRLPAAPGWRLGVLGLRRRPRRWRHRGQACHPSHASVPPADGRKRSEAGSG
jgi:hypothetical protein